MMFVCSVWEKKAILANESKNAGGFDCCLLVGEKSSQGPKNRVNLICFQNSCSASVSCNQQKEYASARERTSFLPHPKEGEAENAANLAGIPWDMQGLTVALLLSEIGCLCLDQSQFDWNKNGTKKEKQKGRKRRKNKKVVFVAVIERQRDTEQVVNTRSEDVFKLTNKEALKRATRWVVGWCEGAWQPHQMGRC